MILKYNWSSDFRHAETESGAKKLVISQPENFPI